MQTFLDSVLPYLLFGLAVVLLVAEMLIPAFGLWAALGILCLMAGLGIAVVYSEDASRTLGIGLTGFVALTVIAVLLLRRFGVWRRFVLKEALSTEEGFVSQESKDHLVGAEGFTLTPLRPAGTVQLESGVRVDVVTEGEFLPPGTRVRIVMVEGARVVAAATGQ